MTEVKNDLNESAPTTQATLKNYGIVKAVSNFLRNPLKIAGRMCVLYWQGFGTLFY